MSNRKTGVGGVADAVVIGAGFSGLAAALQLQDAGIDVQVLEAKGQVGGRVRSLDRGDGVEEAGGTTIGGGYRAVIAAAERCQVPLVDATPMLAFFREQVLVLNGTVIPQSAWPSHPANPFPDEYKALLPWSCSRVLTARHNPLAKPDEWLVHEQARWDISLAAWLRQLGFSDAAVEIGYNLNASYGRDADDISTLMLFARAAFSAAQRQLTPPGVVGFTARDGVQRIAEGMAGQLRRDVRLNTAVAAIESDRREARLHCADGAIWRTPHVVCSLPFSALRHMAIEPPLPPAQAEAVTNLAYQPMTQIYFACRSPFWETDGFGPSMFTDGVAGMVAANRRATNPDEVTGLTAWAMGRNAERLDALSETDAANLVASEIEAARPAARGQLQYVGKQSWGTDPFAGGGWAYFRPGQIARFGTSIGAAHGRIHFCGEHLAHVNRGMEGAMESGLRAAAEVVGAEERSEGRT